MNTCVSSGAAPHTEISPPPKALRATPGALANARVASPTAPAAARALTRSNDVFDAGRGSGAERASTSIASGAGSGGSGASGGSGGSAGGSTGGSTGGSEGAAGCSAGSSAG
jgi:peptidoglycan DL-endopeptidase CwlO